MKKLDLWAILIVLWILWLSISSSVPRRFECDVGFHHWLLYHRYNKLKRLSLFVSTMAELVQDYVDSTPTRCCQFVSLSETNLSESCMVTLKNCVMVLVLCAIIRWLFRIDNFHDLTLSVSYHRETEEGWRHPKCDQYKATRDSSNHVWHVSRISIFGLFVWELFEAPLLWSFVLTENSWLLYCLYTDAVVLLVKEGIFWYPLYLVDNSVMLIL